MPTYRATEVTATLSVFPLEETLQWQKFAADGFKGGTALRERPISADGSDKGVQQFIGEYEDMPLFMVEARDTFPTSQPASEPVQVADDTMTDSPLTSLNTTPARGFAQSSLHNSPAINRRDSVMEDSLPDDSFTAPQPFPNFTQAQTFLAPKPSAQALMLTVQTGPRSHLPRPKGRQATDVRPMKIEVFLDGQLVGTLFINPKRVAISVDKISHFAGTRITKSTEKPWLYQPVTSTNGTSKSKNSAQHIWNEVNGLLQKEADARGQDSKGIATPSADYLRALSGLVFPERLRDEGNLSILDLVLTIGPGHKLGPSYGFLYGPTRMPRMVVEDDAGEPDVHETYPVEPPKAVITHPSKDTDVPFTSPNVTLSTRPRNLQARRDKTGSGMPPPSNIPKTPVKLVKKPTAPAASTRKVGDIDAEYTPPQAQGSKTGAPSATKSGSASASRQSSGGKLRAPNEETIAFAKQLGIKETLTEDMILPTYKNNRGKPCYDRRLTLRLSDILRMSASKEKDRAIQEVKDHFVKKDDASKSSKPARRRNTRSGDTQQTQQPLTSLSAEKPPPKKKAKLKGPETEDKRVKKDKDVQSSPSTTSSAVVKKAFTPGSRDRPSNFGPISFNDQAALVINTPTPAGSGLGTKLNAIPGFGVPPSGRLFQRSIAGSPTPDMKSSTSGAGSSTLEAAKKDGNDAVKKVTRKGGPKQAEHLTFTLPERISSTSAIAYAGGNVTRVIPNTRPGELNEDELVVGMRFLVI